MLLRGGSRQRHPSNRKLRLPPGTERFLRGPDVRVRVGRIDIVRLLLDNGVDINARPLREREYSTALHLASYTGHLEVVQSLLEWGENVLLWDICGKTPSQYALISGWLISECGMGGV